MRLKRICSLILCVMLCLNVLSGCGNNIESTETSNETPVLDKKTIPENEYDRAIWYRFVDEQLSKNRTVTWREYCTMIQNMLTLKDEELGKRWQRLASLALESNEPMLREQGCFVLYRAAELMGEELNDRGHYSTDPHLLPSNDGTLPFSFDYTIFTGKGNDSWVFEDTYEGLFGTMSYMNAAIMFCQCRTSLCSFETLYDTQKDITALLTVEEAALSVLRLYECAQEPMELYWLTKMERINNEVSAIEEPEAVTQLRNKILATESQIEKSDTQIPGKTYTGTAYYVSNNGNDDNDGLTPETAWKTIDKINKTAFEYGDAIFFERGGTYRGILYLYHPEGYVTVSAYGEGAKPVITSSEECATGSEKWTLWKNENGVKIWKYYKDCLDCGLIVFNDEIAGRKILADWSGSEWINEDGSSFDIAKSLVENFDFFSDDGGKFGGATDFYVNDSSADDVKYGPLYLRCDEGNPGEIYNCIELCTMTTTDMSNGSYEGTVLNGVDGTVFDNLSIKYFPMGGVCPGMTKNSVVQNCEIAWGGGCVQFVSQGKITGRMGDAINGCGIESCSITGNYIHDVASSSLIIESYSDVHINNISVNGNLMERTSNGININDNTDVSFENVSFNDNIFYLVGVSDMSEYDIRNGELNAGEWSACYKIREPYEYTNCTISGNKMYYPLHLFYYCDVPLPDMSDNLYIPSKYNSNFAYIRYNVEIGPFIPTLLDESETIIRDVFHDSTSIIDFKSID